MADHIRLRERKSNFERYQHAIADLFAQLTVKRAKKVHDDLETAKKTERVLLIIIGSQKGLCGSFNTNVLYGIW